MNPVQLIQKKRDGATLSAAEIAELVSGYVTGEVDDAQMAAWAMAVYFRGMTGEETAALTSAMLDSGERLARSRSRQALGAQPDVPNSGEFGYGSRPRVDKHSTGGIGDKVSLILAPLLACCGLDVPMLSGRGLGATGGTLDKLEAIPGFRTNLSPEEIDRCLADVGCVITGQTATLVPADKKLYALRDVTGTVPSLPLITASIMSKKLAESLDALVLDVKWGSGAFMKTQDEARRLACSMIDIGARMGVRTIALVTDMNQPLGQMAGNAVEVQESLAVLGSGIRKNSGITETSEFLRIPLRELTLALGAELLVAIGVAASLDDARKRLQAELESGRALERFNRMVVAQGGNPDAPLKIAPEEEITADSDGFVRAMDCEKLGYAVIALGGGRQRLGEAIDHSVGLAMHVRLGDAVSYGLRLVTLFANQRGRDEACRLVREAITIGQQPPVVSPLIVEVIRG